MDEFLKLAQSKLNLSADDSKSATSAIAGILKDKMPTGDFSELISKIPGLNDLAGKEAEAGGGGLLGGLASGASSMFGGGDSGDALGVITKLATSGLSMDNAGSFIELFTGYVKEKAGDGILGKVLSSVPELKKFVG